MEQRRAATGMFPLPPSVKSQIRFVAKCSPLFPLFTGRDLKQKTNVIHLDYKRYEERSKRK